MNDSGLVGHCLELLSPLGRTSSRRMFGGRALYIDDLCMALIFGDALYLKVNDDSRATFERAGCRPFIYETRDGDHQSLNYYTAPDEAMESPAEMIPWARRALAAAVAARAKAPRKKAAAAKEPAKKSPAKKVGARKVAEPKAPARKTVASKAAAGRPVAKKTARP